MTRDLVISFDSLDASLELAGGKGMNLARLARAGFPVPPGFIVQTAAYRDFVAANHLQEKIDQTLGAVPSDAAPELERASAQIRAVFAAAPLGGDLAAPIRAAYQALKDVPVAVRSSATAED